MEGGIRRGFVQKGQVEGLYFDQSVVFRPLPALPPGSEWVKRDDGLYYIVETRELTVVVGGNGAEPEDTEAPAAAKIPTHKDAPGAAAWHGHVVLESDTIAGLCVSAAKAPRADVLESHGRPLPRPDAAAQVRALRRQTPRTAHPQLLGEGPRAQGPHEPEDPLPRPQGSHDPPGADGRGGAAAVPQRHWPRQDRSQDLPRSRQVGPQLRHRQGPRRRLL
mmetsp:Transcript_15991/g.54591  ORF Transcript_15991/g.54591 Transcript_15991/m.54591 type:complete len:220 (+) Transcript_15991:78-737(+)